MPQQSQNLQLFNMNSLTGISFDKPVSFNEIPTINGSGLALEGQVNGGDVVYITGNQSIAGAKTFSDNIVGNGIDNRLPNQIADRPESIITSQILNNIDYAAISTLTTPNDIAYLPLGSPRLDSNVAQTWGTNNVPANMLPFLITKSFQKIAIKHVSGTHPTALLQIAIYNTDSNGKPTTLVEAGTVALSSTGVKTLTLTQPRRINGLFYIALRPTIGNTNWIPSGGSGQLTIRGASAGHFPQFSQIIGGVYTSMTDFGGSLLYRWASYDESFPSDLTNNSSTYLNVVSNSPIWLCAVHN